MFSQRPYLFSHAPSISPSSLIPTYLIHYSSQNIHNKFLYSTCICMNSQLSSANIHIIRSPLLSPEIYLLNQPTSWRYCRKLIRHYLHCPISTPVAPLLTIIIILLHKSQLPIMLPLQAPFTKLDKNTTHISIIKPPSTTNSSHTPTWCVRPPSFSPPSEYYYSLLRLNSQAVPLLVHTKSRIRHMARLKSTARLVSLSNSQRTPSEQSPY
jgi:hypothetical protein